MLFLLSPFGETGAAGAATAGADGFSVGFLGVTPVNELVIILPRRAFNGPVAEAVVAAIANIINDFILTITSRGEGGWGWGGFGS